jgi:hypothetical protein
MTALVRYLASDVLRGQRWAAPMLAYLVALMIITPTFGPVLPTYAMSAAALLPMGMWFTVVVFHSEEPAQAAITMVTAGGLNRVWPAKLVMALVGCVVLGLAALTWITATTSDHVTPARVGIGALAYAINALAGVAAGTLVSRPVMPKLAWTVLLGVGICMAELLVPYAPPVNAMLHLYDTGDGPNSFGALLIIAAETVVLAGLAIAGANVIARNRT